MTLEEMQEIRDQSKLSYADIAKASNVPAATVQKVFAGDTAKPRRRTWLAIESAMECFQEALLKKDPAEASLLPQCLQSHVLKEHYVLQDYYALPEQERKELIDGVFYDMSSPTSDHQLALVSLSYSLRHFILENGGACQVFVAPLDVILDNDDDTCVQPDIMVVCDPKKVKRRGIYGAPDLIIEILSETTKKHDMVRKNAKYAEAGVREYWMIDLEKGRTIVNRFETDDMYTIYGREEAIPVGIFEGKLVIPCAEFMG